MPSPNVIMVLVDGARLDWIERFKPFRSILERGSLFSNMVTYAPYTTSSLHAIMSGMYGSLNGVDNYYGYFSFQKDKCKTLPEYLHDAGYYTKADTLNKLVLQEQGWDELLIHDEHKDDLLKRHVEMLKQVKNINRLGKRVFLYLHYSNIHTSLVDNVIKKFGDFSEEYFENKPEFERQYDSYFSSAEDYLLGLFAKIDSFGLLKDSVVVVLSDHGAGIADRLGEKVYGSFCYDYTIRTFASFIGSGFSAKEFSEQCRTIDVMPSILELVGVKEDLKYWKMQGKPLSSIIDGVESDSRCAFSETGGLGGCWPSPIKPNVHSLRCQGWKLIENDSPKTVELYNLKIDPREENNLVKENPEKVIELHRKMELEKNKKAVGD